MKKAIGALRENELMVTLCVMVALVMVGLSMVSPIPPLYRRLRRERGGRAGPLLGLRRHAVRGARLDVPAPRHLSRSVARRAGGDPGCNEPAPPLAVCGVALPLGCLVPGDLPRRPRPV